VDLPEGTLKALTSLSTLDTALRAGVNPHLHLINIDHVLLFRVC
jgi:hypothetical protein